MKCKTLLAVLLSLALFAGMIPAMSFGVSAAPTLTDSYEAHKYIVGDAITGTNVNRGSNTLIKFEYGFDLINSGASWLYDYAWCKALYDASGPNYTCTNAYGWEVAVNEFGFVTASSGAGNMKIPTNGYVLSGFDGYKTNLQNNIEVGDYIRMSGDVYYVYKTTDDSKFTDASAAFSVKKTQILEIVEGGSTPTKATQWTTTVLCKATGTGSDGVANHSGYLVKFGGKEITVPTGYFALVLSGTPLKDTGADSYNAAQLFYEFASPGAIVNIGANSIYFRYDAAAAKRAARLMSGTTDSTVTTTYDYAAATILNDAETKYELVDTARMQTLYTNMAAIADAVQSMTTIEAMEPYMATLYQNYAELQTLEYEQLPVEMRAIWWRPLENDRKQRTAAELDTLIESNVRNFKELGYNMLFVETFYNSCTIYPVPASAGYNGLCFQQNPYLVPTSMGGLNANLSEPYDMLQRTIEICAEYDVECHAWWQVLYVGYERHNVANSDDLVEYGVGYTIEQDIQKNGSNSKYYNWLNVAHDGSFRSGTTSTLTRFWLNPANSGVRQFLLNNLSYLCANYDIDSFQLDYFRHPNDGTHEFGYDSDTVAAFKAKYPAYKNTDLTQTSYWKNADWVQFRADYITSLIGEMRVMLDEQYPAVCLTTSPQPDPAAALKDDLQDVSTWLGNGYIDTIFPMAYGYHIPGYVTPTLVEQNSERFVCTGLAVGYDDPALELSWIRQIRHAGADGVASFGETIPEYAESIWSKPAVTPTGNAARAARVYLSDTVAARAAKMLELGAITQTKYNSILSAVENADFAIRVNGIESSAALTAINALQTVANGLSANPKAALTNDVNYILKIRRNSHDTARQAREEAKVEHTFDDVGGATYISGSDTLYVTVNGTKLSGAITQAVTVLTAEAVAKLELNGVSFKAGNGAAFEVLGDALQLELTGDNNVTADTFATLDVTYCGTGALHSDGALQFQMGDVSNDGLLNSTDIRDLLRVNVKYTMLTDSQKAISDANGDGKINTIDTRIFLDAYIG